VFNILNGPECFSGLGERKRAHKRTKQEKPTQREKPTSGSHDPKPVVPQTNYHTLTTMGFQLSRFVFGDVLRIQERVCLRRLALASGIRFGFGCLVCTFRKALRMQEWAVVLGSFSFRESREKSGSTVGSAGKSWKPCGGKVFVSL